jgi:glycosyltransferase involved in cell wall biosynthesis
MPVYNTSAYLSEAVDSVINQTYSNWELICVDDGSTDNSLDILKRYSILDNRVKLIEVPHGGTPSRARNIGIKYCTGDYIMTLDSDDKLNNDVFQKVNDKINITGADAIILKIYFWDYKKDFVYDIIAGYHNDFTKIISGNSAFVESLNWNIATVGAIKSSIVKKYRYLEKGINGDEFSSRLFLLKSETVTFVDAVYFYRKNLNSTTKQKSTKLYYVLDTEQKLYELVSATSVLRHLKKELQCRYINLILNIELKFFVDGLISSTNEKLKILKYIQLHINYIKSRSFFVQSILLRYKLLFVKFLFRLLKIKIKLTTGINDV